MGVAQKWMEELSRRLELPADALSGVPRVELIGTGTVQMEPHRGLLEYTADQICVASAVGPVRIVGSGLRIKLMNLSQITVCGTVGSVVLQETTHE